MDKPSKARKLLRKRSQNQINTEQFLSEAHAITESDAILKGSIPDRVSLAGKLLSELIEKSIKKPTPERSPPETRNIAIKITPSEEAQITIKAEDAEFVSDIKDAGFIQFSKEEMAEVREYLPEGFSSEQLTTAFHLYSQGVSSKQLEEGLDQSPVIEGLSEKQAESLYGTAYLISVFEDDDPQRSIALSSQSPDISIEEVSPETKSTPSQIVFELKEYARPLIDKVVGKGTTAAKKKIKGIATKALKKSSKKLAKLAAKKGAGLALKAGVLAAAEAAGIAVSGPLAPIITALLWVGGKILKGIKKALSKISEVIFGKGDQGKKIVAAGAAVLLGGIVLSSALLVGLGSVLIIGGAFVTVGGIALGTGVGAVVTFFVILITTPARAFAAWLIGSILLVMFIATLVVFIINSGAYVVPEGPESESGLIENPYIGLEKLARRPSSSSKCTDTDVAPGELSPFIDCENSDLSFTIEYTITIEAKTATLTNISFEHDCTVIRDGSTPSCPSPLPSEIPALISPAEPFTFTYSASYGSSFTDSLVLDVFTVRADVESLSVFQTEAIASATIRIGDPPDECPQGWPVGGSFNQGAYSSSTHRNAEAIDIGANTGTSVSARHSGIARVESVAQGGPFGNNVEIVSICPNSEFFSRYAHFSSTLVNTGEFVSLGQIIGEVGSTGNSTGPHLHYEFRGPSGPKSATNPPNMLIPYIPQNLPRGCVGYTSCGSIIIP